jgi:NAD+ kinase
MSGYETDRSETNGVDEYDEEGGNLTKQLAETAQGVREMSKELGKSSLLLQTSADG